MREVSTVLACYRTASVPYNSSVSHRVHLTCSSYSCPVCEQLWRAATWGRSTQAAGHAPRAAHAGRGGQRDPCDSTREADRAAAEALQRGGVRVERKRLRHIRQREPAGARQKLERREGAGGVQGPRVRLDVYIVLT